jgi:hypothetical protein
VHWRLISVDAVDGTRGAYSIDWVNNSDVTLTASFTLRFYDAGGFQLDRWPWACGGLLSCPERTLAPGASGHDTGNFYLGEVTSVSTANQIARMAVWASFDTIRIN